MNINDKLKKTLKRIIYNIVIPSVITIAVLFGLSRPPSESNIIYGQEYYNYFAENAEYWFDELGWNGSAVYANSSVAKNDLSYSYYFYEIGHGSSYKTMLLL